LGLGRRAPEWGKRVAAPMQQGSPNPKADLAGPIRWFGSECLFTGRAGRNRLYGAVTR